MIAQRQLNVNLAMVYDVFFSDKNIVHLCSCIIWGIMLLFIEMNIVMKRNR